MDRTTHSTESPKNAGFKKIDTRNFTDAWRIWKLTGSD